jgi:hypothetical protein
MIFQSLFNYLHGAWQELALGGLVGYLVAALKPLSTIIKGVLDYRKGKGRVKAEGKLIPGLDDRQKAARHNNRDGFRAGQLLEVFEVKVRNIGSVPAFVEDVWLSDRDGSTYHAYKNTSTHGFLVPIGDQSAIAIDPGSYHNFVVRIPFDKDIGELMHWCVSFNNGVIWKAYLRTWRQRLFRR